MSVGVTRSVRVPAGIPERVKAASGMNFSEFIRVVCDNFLKVAEKNRELQQAASVLDNAVADAVEESLESKDD